MSMSRVPQDGYLATGFQGATRQSRQQIANASSTRSRSPSDSHNGNYGEGSSAGPSSTHRSIDGNSQNTAVSTGVAKIGAQVQVTQDIELEQRNARTDSDRTSNSGGTPIPDLGDFDETKLTGPPKSLTKLDIAALILNKQIGTGIFTTPGAVLLSTKSKGLSVGLWTIGGFWTLMFLFIYLEFGEAFPYNGGELIYLDEIYHRPQLLATILFSGYFLMLANSYGNSIQFAKHVLIAALPDLKDGTELDTRLVRYIAISVITLVCLIHWHSPNAGLFLNKLVAWYKIALLLAVFVAGMVWSGRNDSQWGSSNDGSSTIDGMTGMVLIFYSYQGWENANYVAGEIRNKDRKFDRKTLEIGAILGVAATWILYSDLAVATKFAPKVFGAPMGLKVCMALSAFGNIIAVTYTASKVQRILPFYKFLSADRETPKGALFLHWITSVIFVAVAPSSSDGYSFAVGIYTYGHIVFSVFVAIGLFRLRKRVRTLRFFDRKPLLYTVSFIFALGNILILVFAGKTHKAGKIARWWWPVVAFIVLFVSGMYWLGIRLFMTERISNRTGLKIRIEQEPRAVVTDTHEALAKAVDGSGRRVITTTDGRLKDFVDGVKELKRKAGEHFL
ncbi:hypothetical protein N0V87_010285 [Didymella glomerata]|uniref:Uncharacterized protein n=1 Tax=Didymella glomerata TaxID=749621 RepID=A0A9W9BVK5_9PLEO|nr:hypothetical protein N0V87_010285 [Didymella glomerata]